MDRTLSPVESNEALMAPETPGPINWSRVKNPFADNHEGLGSPGAGNEVADRPVVVNESDPVWGWRLGKMGELLDERGRESRHSFRDPARLDTAVFGIANGRGSDDRLEPEDITRLYAQEGPLTEFLNDRDSQEDNWRMGCLLGRLVTNVYVLHDFGDKPRQIVIETPESLEEGSLSRNLDAFGAGIVLGPDGRLTLRGSIGGDVLLEKSSGAGSAQLDVRLRDIGGDLLADGLASAAGVDVESVQGSVRLRDARRLDGGLGALKTIGKALSLDGLVRLDGDGLGVEEVGGDVLLPNMAYADGLRLRRVGGDLCVDRLNSDEGLGSLEYVGGRVNADRLPGDQRTALMRKLGRE
ncbi:hypothetical protein CR970_04350 [Candidatus Saccharibacteria bacterium]|nr:MAG: hypothetical protein CR970_04350 [Candidatus Saccharibacteria bacterium]